MNSTASTVEPNKQCPAWARRMYDLSNHLLFDAGGGPRTLRLEQAINLQKAVTLLFIYGLMHYYGNFTVGAWVYLGLHGIYGYTWLIKDLAFPNRAFHARITIGSLVLLWGGLNVMYWTLPWLFISRHVEPSAPVIFAAIAMHSLGIALMTAADVQKNCTLAFRPGLIDTGVFAFTRNPNYLGEILIYATYALLAAHWLGWLIIAVQLVCLFLPRMLAKDTSISRHPGWPEYERRSSLLIPWALLNGKAWSPR